MCNWRITYTISIFILLSYSNLVCGLENTTQFDDLVKHLEQHLEKHEGSLTLPKIKDGLLKGLIDSTSKIQALIKEEYFLTVDSSNINVSTNRDFIVLNISGGSWKAWKTELLSTNLDIPGVGFDTIAEIYVSLNRSHNESIANRLFSAALKAIDNVRIKEIEGKLNKTESSGESSSWSSNSKTKIAVIVVCVIGCVIIIVLVFFVLNSQYKKNKLNTTNITNSHNQNEDYKVGDVVV